MQPVFIVAQYKSGTSWLLSALSAHPAVRGLRELDIIKATFARDGSLRPTTERLEGFFGSSAWCRHDILPDLEAGTVHTGSEDVDPDRPQSYADLSGEQLLGLYEAIREADSAAEVLDAFVAVAAEGGGQSHLVLKGADQIAVFDHLQAWRPDAPKVAIVRDVRDAAISAQHFRRLMAEQDAPWLSGGTEYFDLLKGMAARSHLIADRAEAGELYVLRYEDLSADFIGEFGALLQALGLRDDEELITAINDRTSFEARTGRPRGTEGKGVVRKGAVGEWVEALDPDSKQLAWELAGDALQRLGYMRDGTLRPLPVSSLRP